MAGVRVPYDLFFLRHFAWRCTVSVFLQVSRWLESHRDVGFVLVRMYLGVGLFVRGVLFIIRPESYTARAAGADGSLFASPVVIYLVAAVHIVGGAMLAAGFYTRLAAIANLPILLVA